MLQAVNVFYSYKPDHPVLKDISVSLERGKILYLLGHNGSGKTTLMSCLSGILKPTQGHIELDGTDIRHIDPAERARKIGLIPQLHVPVFAYSVREMVLMGRAPYLGLFGAPGKQDYVIVDEALERVGLDGFRGRTYTELSGGERQLVMIARGLAQQCDYLLMDEPDAHLDPSNQHRILEIVAGLSQQGLSFIIASHAPNSALMYADQVMLMRQGCALKYGAVTETLTETLLSQAYDMDTEVIYKGQNGKLAPRAIVPRRYADPDGIDIIRLKPTSLSTPGSSLESIFRAGKTDPQIIMVTGESGSGKSAWCSDLVMEAQRRGLRVAGLLSPAVIRNGRKTGIDLVDLGSGQRRRLAHLRLSETTDVMTDMWAFDMDVVQWGNSLLEQAPACDLLVIDELGPLELKHRKGFTAALGLIGGGGANVTCVVVRPSLLQVVLTRWPSAYVVDVDADRN